MSPITITLWGNDVAELSDACQDKLACIRARAPRATAQFASRLSSILRRLRVSAPKAEIIVTGAWDDNVAKLKQNDPLIHGLDATIARTTASAKARFADTFPTFNPQGSLAREKARICALTFTCSEGGGHPTNAGYRAIAAAVWAASGYSDRS